MAKKIKHMISLLLTGLLLLSGLGVTLQHLECNHCDLFAHSTQTQSKEISACCASKSMSFTDTYADSECECSQNISIAEQNQDTQTVPPMHSSLKIVIFTCVLFLFNFLRIPAIQRLFSPFKTSSAYIASGRQILSLNAILLI
ncbi:MAG: hypothetical protein ACRC26_01460 [Bacteroidales bacterium]